MADFGLHSEVGKLRKVMVHRPEPSLQRLTPTNHDDRLFDDVLWVERAQYEHDRFVEKMREGGVEVFLASDEGRQRLIEVAASEYTVGVSLVDEVRNTLANLKPDDLAQHLIGGRTVAGSGIDLAKFKEFSLPAAPLDDPSTFILPPLPNTLFTRDDGRFQAADFGRASMEGGDVQPIGNGTVLIGLSPFLVTTLADEPASIVTLLTILLVSIGLDVGWSRRRDSTATQIGGS